jgi:hypothetical protein
MSSTLSRFGVPLGSGAGRGGILQPKVKYKFRVRVINFGPLQGGLELTQQVMTVGRPKASQEPVAVHSYNSIAYYGGKPSWETINLKIRDDVTNSMSTMVGYQLQKQMNHFDQTSALSGVNYKFNMYIETLDGGDDTVLEQWYLEGCFLSSTEYEDFDYSSSETMSITMTIRYDNATQSGGLMPTTVQLLPGTMIG